jgi:hypothetical protein
MRGQAGIREPPDSNGVATSPSRYQSLSHGDEDITAPARFSMDVLSSGVAIERSASIDEPISGVMRWLNPQIAQMAQMIQSSDRTGCGPAG